MSRLDLPQELTTDHKSYPRLNDGVDPLYDYPPTSTWTDSALHWLMVDFEGCLPISEIVPPTNMPKVDGQVMDIARRRYGLSEEEMRNEKNYYSWGLFYLNMESHLHEIEESRRPQAMAEFAEEYRMNKSRLPSPTELQDYLREKRREIREGLNQTAEGIANGFMQEFLAVLALSGIGAFFEYRRIPYVFNTSILSAHC